MKAKINIRSPDGSIKTINKTIRDRELIDINNKNCISLQGFDKYKMYHPDLQ